MIKHEAITGYPQILQEYVNHQLSTVGIWSLDKTVSSKKNLWLTARMIQRRLLARRGVVPSLTGWHLAFPHGSVAHRASRSQDQPGRTAIGSRGPQPLHHAPVQQTDQLHPR